MAQPSEVLSRKRSGSCRTDIAASAGNGKRRAPNAFLSPPTGGTLFYVLLSNHSGCGFPRCDLFALPVQGICRVGIVRKTAIARCANSPSRIDGLWPKKLTPPIAGLEQMRF